MKSTVQDHGNNILYLIVFFLLLPELNFLVAAQPLSGPSRNGNLAYSRLSPTVVIIIAAIVTAVFCFVMFTAYIRNRNGSSSTSTVFPAINRRIVAAMAPGLDDSVLETFPTFTYSEVKSLKKVDGALECAVCLNEFEDDETLRLIPKCDHVFHIECIDSWLEFHVTCPVCRANLVPQPGDEPVRVPHLIDNMVERCNSRNDEIMIDVNDGNRHQENPPLMNRNLSSQYPNRSRSKIFGLDKIRSYSTGHASKNLERFTLRLPVEIRKEAMKRALLNPSRSCAARLSREGSSRKGYKTGDGEGSNRTGRFNRIRGVKSDRWNFVTRPFSMSGRLLQFVVDTKEGSGSSKGSTSKGVRDRIPVKMPSL